MSEQQLINRLKSGDHTALKPLMILNQNYVYTVALRMVKQKELAEEVTQDVFIKVYKKIDSYREQSKFTTWLYTIVYRTCLNYLDKKKIVFSESHLKSNVKNSSITQDVDLQQSQKESPGEYFEYFQNSPELTFDIQEILWKAIDRLSYQQGVIITLFYIQEFSVSEIAEIMQLPPNTIKTQLFRGRNNLKEVLLKKYVAEDLV